jgi:hypothetical protein
MRNPMVNIITHPANRSPALSPGYDLDYDRLFETAIATGTALEVDGAPGHLDMDGSIARRAVDAGVTLTIDRHQSLPSGSGLLHRPPFQQSAIPTPLAFRSGLRMPLLSAN